MRLLLGARLKKTKKMRGISGDHDDDDDDDDWKSGDGEVRSFFSLFLCFDGKGDHSIERGLEFSFKIPIQGARFTSFE